MSQLSVTRSRQRSALEAQGTFTLGDDRLAAHDTVQTNADENANNAFSIRIVPVEQRP
jgi:hypothetical protein